MFRLATCFCGDKKIKCIPPSFSMQLVTIVAFVDFDFNQSVRQEEASKHGLH